MPPKPKAKVDEALPSMDEVLRRMLNTPPQPHVVAKPKSPPKKTAK